MQPNRNTEPRELNANDIDSVAETTPQGLQRTHHIGWRHFGRAAAMRGGAF